MKRFISPIIFILGIIVLLCACTSDNPGKLPAKSDIQQSIKTATVTVSKGSISISGNVAPKSIPTGTAATGYSIKESVYKSGQTFFCKLTQGETAHLLIKGIQKNSVFTIQFAGKTKKYNVLAGSGFKLEQTLIFGETSPR